MGAAVSFAQTYPTTPVNSSVGSLFCGVRLFTATSVQTYCYRVAVGQPAALVHNTITTLTTGTAVVSGFINGPDQVLWIVQQSTTPGQPTYQISTSVDPWKGGVLALFSPPGLPQSNYEGACCFRPSPLPAPFDVELYMLREKPISARNMGVRSK